MRILRSGERETCHTYDGQGRLLTVTGPKGELRQRRVYDGAGHLRQTLDGQGRGVGYTYDLADRRTGITTTGGAGQSHTYDPFGRVTSVTDREGNTTRYALDAWGRIVEIKKADGSREHYGYDYAGNLISATDGEGNTTTYHYNQMNRMAVMTDPEGKQETYAYDAEGRLCRQTDRRGIETHYTYNLYGNLLSRRAGELVETYQYTPEGLLKAAIADGMHYRYTYDVMGRLKEKQASGRTLLSLSYDLNGNLTRQEDVTGKVTEYVYNGLDQVGEVWDSGKLLAAYTYYPDGRMKSLKNGDSLYTRYTYDADKNLTHQKTMLGNELLVDNHYCYDGNGNRIQKQQLSGTTRYTYDTLNRLKRVEYPTFTEELFYDRAGNRVKRVAGEEEETYHYDTRNRLTERIRKGGEREHYTYDEAGNLLRDGRASYTYDAFGRCERIETFHGAVQINRYDAQGLRAEIEENGRLVQFIYRDREVVVEERAEEKVRYIRTDKLLASDAQNAKTWYHYASDELGSITHVEAEGEVRNRYEYDAWGNLTTCEEQVENRFKFTGQQLDPISQQYYLRARYYNPVIGRFTQEDTYYEDGLNLYAYCRNNPVNYVDPSGNTCDSASQVVQDQMNSQSANRGENKKVADHHEDKVNGGEVLTAQESSVARQTGVGGKSGRKTDFYVTPSGEAIPSTGYRYISENASYLDDMTNSMSIPANADGTYFSFNNYDVANPGVLQVPHDASVKVSFDTLQIIDDISVPYGNWRKASYLEPITMDFPQFGPGGATQVITHSPINISNITRLPK